MNDKPMIKQIAMVALTILIALFLISAFFRMLTGLFHLIVLGLAIGVGAVVTLLVIIKINHFWRGLKGEKTLKKWDDK